MTTFARFRIPQPLADPKTRALCALALFVVVQVADGILTSIGIARFGPSIEANPLLFHTIATFGSGTALVLAKSIAIVGGSVLHVYSYHLVLASLTVAYVYITLLPWAILLA